MHPCPTCGLPLAPLPAVVVAGPPLPDVAECERGHQVELDDERPTCRHSPRMMCPACAPVPPRLVTSADLGLTRADLMAYADKPGPSVVAERMASAGPSDPVSDLRALQARLERTGWFSAPLAGQ